MCFRHNSHINRSDKNHFITSRETAPFTSRYVYNTLGRPKRPPKEQRRGQLSLSLTIQDLASHYCSVKRALFLSPLHTHARNFLLLVFPIAALTKTGAHPAAVFLIRREGGGSLRRSLGFWPLSLSLYRCEQDDSSKIRRLRLQLRELAMP